MRKACRFFATSDGQITGYQVKCNNISEVDDGKV